MYENLKKKFGQNFLIDKNILLKIEQEGSLTEAKNILQNIMVRSRKHADFKAIRFIVDIDPVQ